MSYDYRFMQKLDELLEDGHTHTETVLQWKSYVIRPPERSIRNHKGRMEVVEMICSVFVNGMELTWLTDREVKYLPDFLCRTKRGRVAHACYGYLRKRYSWLKR